MSETKFREWLPGPKLERYAKKAYGKQIRLPGLRRLDAIGAVDLKYRRVPAPTRKNPNRTVSEYHWSVLMHLSNLRVRLEDGQTISEIAREKRTAKLNMIEKMSESFSRVPDDPSKSSFEDIEQGMREERLEDLTDIYLMSLPESERMILLRVASARRDGEGGKRPQQDYVREEVWRNLGGDQIAETKLLDWATQIYQPLANELSDRWKDLIQLQARANRMILDKIKEGSYERAFQLALRVDSLLTPVAQQINKDAP